MINDCSASIALYVTHVMSLRHRWCLGSTALVNFMVVKVLQEVAVIFLHATPNQEAGSSALSGVFDLYPRVHMKPAKRDHI